MNWEPEAGGIISTGAVSLPAEALIGITARAVGYLQGITASLYREESGGVPSLQAQPLQAPLGSCFPFPMTLVGLPGSRGPLPSHSCGHRKLSQSECLPGC